MQKKKIKKLMLSVETLRNLNEPDLQDVAGGVTAVCGTRFDCTYTYACSGCQPCA